MTTAASSEVKGKPDGTWPEVLTVFLRLGLTSFGGPVARLGDFALAAAALVMLAVWKAPPWLVVIVCAVGGTGLARLQGGAVS